jgi:hypothetical protein
LVEVNNINELEELLGITLARYRPKEDIDHPGIELSMLANNLAIWVAKADALAIEDACKIISHDPHLPFGKLIKSGLSRALKKSAQYIPEKDRKKIVNATAALLSLEFCPRETEDYCKLIKKLGAKEVLATISLASPIDVKSKTLVEGLNENIT